MDHIRPGHAKSWIAIAGLLAACEFEPGRLARDARVDDASDASDASDAPGDGPRDASVDAPDAPVPACPGTYTLDPNGSAYRFVSSTAAWLAAEQDCEDDLPDHTHLVVLDQNGEASIVDAISTATVWIGSSNRIDMTSWRWVTGSAAPNLGSTPGRCGRFSTEYNNSNDDNCTTSSWRYVCECDHVAAQPGTAY